MSKLSDQALCHLIEGAVACAFDGSVRLVGGFDEPEYLPAEPGRLPEIRYVHDYPRSALHEVSHWCIAGAARRRLPDFGYWYTPAHTRNRAQQQAFERVEVKPQALEALFCGALGLQFRVSIDNLDNGPVDAVGFERAVAATLRDYQRSPPPRAAQFVTSLYARLQEARLCVS